MNYLIEYKQTKGGRFDSRPQIEDVRAAWFAAEHAGTQQWALDAANRGHGEYIDNVIGFVDAMHAHRFGYDDISLMLAVIAPVEA